MFCFKFSISSLDFASVCASFYSILFFSLTATSRSLPTLSRCDLTLTKSSFSPSISLFIYSIVSSRIYFSDWKYFAYSSLSDMNFCISSLNFLWISLMRSSFFAYISANIDLYIAMIWFSDSEIPSLSFFR